MKAYQQIGYLCLVRHLKLFFEWYVRASFHVSLALVSLVAFTGQVFGQGISPHYYWALFLGSVATYNGIKYGLEAGKHKYRIPGGLRILILLSFLCLVLAGYHLWYLKPAVWLILAVCGGITVLYAIPLLPGMRNLRSFGILKVIMVALVWTLASVVIPLFDSYHFGVWDFWVTCFQRFVWVFLLMLPFEIRDMKKDPVSLRTIPQRLGIFLTRLIAWACTIVFVFSSWLKEGPATGEIICTMVTGVILGLSVQFASEDQSAYYASFWVESIPVFSLALLLLLQL